MQLQIMLLEMIYVSFGETANMLLGSVGFDTIQYSTVTFLSYYGLEM